MKLTLPELSLVVLVGVSGSGGGQNVRASDATSWHHFRAIQLT